MANFADPVEEKKEFKSFDKAVFMNLTPGTHLIRLLQTDYYEFNQHWLNGSILCLGDDCPQCDYNKKVLAEVKGNFKDAIKVKGFSSRQKRGAVNVLDRTPVKVCPQCQSENTADDMGRFPSVCKDCGTIITSAVIKPSNKVKLLSRSGNLFDKFKIFHQSRLDENGEPIGITNFDIEILVSNKTSIPRPTNNTDKVEVPEDTFFDLHQAVVELTAEEMEQKMRGVSLKDIFSARRATRELTEVTDEEPVTEEDLKDIDESIDKLFG